jgi:hypothetical protein
MIPIARAAAGSVAIAGAWLTIASTHAAAAPPPVPTLSPARAVTSAPPATALPTPTVPLPVSTTAPAGGPIEVPAGHVDPSRGSPAWEIFGLAGLGVSLLGGGVVAIRRR